MMRKLGTSCVRNCEKELVGVCTNTTATKKQTKKTPPNLEDVEAACGAVWLAARRLPRHQVEDLSRKKQTNKNVKHL
jgi:hypothetical protein